ncbi:hypothetical protein C7N43_35095 [Sphingobacteriales bacterium UPWRP_1]|nr:hypothetical protein C7N43_35095 [Sphingobacteriales bacterium UPWRP_1]
MTENRNDYQQQITRLFRSATQSIKVAVSWFTNAELIRVLIQHARAGIKVEVLLSADELNLLRHKMFRELLQASGQVRKLGSALVSEGGFMHTKAVIIDNKLAYGGSYNFSRNANTHYEQFRKWDDKELSDNWERKGILTDFNSWFAKADDYFAHVTDPEAALQKFLLQYGQETGYSAVISADNFPEEEYIARKEKEQEAKSKKEAACNLYTSANGVTTQTHTVAPNGKIVPNTSGVTSKPHHFYGGRTALINTARSSKRTHTLSVFQKRCLESNFNFLKCGIQRNGTLVCTGELQPENCDRYKFRIEFREGHAPVVFIKSPQIVPKPEIHMYREGCLCLYDPGEFKWRDTTQIAQYTIPWMVEWILYYELWKLTGKWEGPEHVH